MVFKIEYGTSQNKIDITSFCYSKLKRENRIIIPSNDNVRAIYFSDPHYAVVKKIFITDQFNNLNEYNSNETVVIDIETNKITSSVSEEINKRLADIQSKLKIRYGNFNDELPEQTMAVRYLTGDEKVLEIGSNIGRNSLVIAYILAEKNNHQLVTLECSEYIANQLRENKELNNATFHIESAALSKRNLIQRGWNTVESDIVLEGYQKVKTISLEELRQKYQIDFDTLVLDCEGAFYYILMDMPEILDNVKLIIMENDYHNTTHKEYVDDILKKHGFYLDYVESGGSDLAYSIFPNCYNYFFEAWKRTL
jgi:FkbM family methyltransferase